MSIKHSMTLLLTLMGIALGIAAWLQHHAMSTRSSQLASLRHEMYAIRSNGSAEVLSQEIQRLQLSANQFTEALASQDDVAELLQSVTSDLESLKVSDRSLATETATTVGGFQRVPLNLSFKGSFDDAFQLMNILSERKWLVRLDRLVIKRDLKGTSSGLSISIRLIAFIRMEKEKA